MRARRSSYATRPFGRLSVLLFLAFWGLLLWRFHASPIGVVTFFGGIVAGCAARILAGRTRGTGRVLAIAAAVGLLLACLAALGFPTGTSPGLAGVTALSGGIGGWLLVSAFQRRSRKGPIRTTYPRAAGLAMDVALLGMVAALFWFDLGMGVALLGAATALTLLVRRHKGG